MRKVRTLLTKPIFLSIPLAIIIILLLPLEYDKYLLRMEYEERIGRDWYIWYDDLNFDGNSEKILAYELYNVASLVVYNESGLINQWNLKGKFGFANQHTLFITGDYDNKGSKEIYIFTLQNDTILLHSLYSVYDRELTLRNRFIDIAGQGINSPDPHIVPARMEDLDGDGTKELIFGITSGFSKFPRNVYVYYIEQDSLVKSPESFFNFNEIIQEDITGNGTSEILLVGYSSCNLNDTNVIYHDCSNWLMVLNSNLEYLFAPVEFESKFSGIFPFTLKNHRTTDLYVLTNLPYENSKILKINESGYVSETFHLGFVGNMLISNTCPKFGPLLGIYENDRGFHLFDSRFIFVRFIPFKQPGQILQVDLTGDGKEEIIIPQIGDQRLYVFRNGFRNPVSIDLAIERNFYHQISVKRENGNPPVIYLQSGEKHYLISYRENSLYLLNFLIFFLVYTGSLGFTVLIKLTQKGQLEKKYKAEKKINELQLSMLRNQLSDHFSLNAVNAVMYSVMSNKTDEACENLRKFAGLYKTLLLSAGSVLRKLSDEIEFCENYLSLEKSRFNGKFDFNIRVSPGVDKDFHVPVMSIHLYAENAVKHGLSPLKTKGILNIVVEQFANTLIIEINDNGVGREYAIKNPVKSTGKGLEMMNEFYSHLKTYHNYEVNAELTDLYDESDQPAGTKVELKITSGYA